jgi:hypothetical protein
MSERKDTSINQAQHKAEYIHENSANLNTITFVSSIPKNPSSRQLRRKSRYHCVRVTRRFRQSVKKIKELMPCVPREKKAADKSGQLFPSIHWSFLSSSRAHSLPLCRAKRGGRVYHFELRSKKYLSCFGPFVVRSSVVGISTLPSSDKPLYLVATALPELQ